MRNLFLTICFMFLSYCLNAQDEKILFIGNSYTFIEDIPNMFYEVANSTGDNLLVEAQTAGSATFEYHATSQAVTDKINSDNWDYVILQGQSVEVALTGDYFDTNVAPFAAQLCQTIRTNDQCSQPVFYRTWGRQLSQTGPACTGYPWVCTYEGMDDALAQNYRTLADDNEGVISPVGQVWRYLIDNSAPVDLYHPDQSHQSEAGAYVSACTFYAIILRKDPTLITYQASLPQVEAEIIRDAVKTVVYDQLAFWKVEEFDPIANFTFEETNGLTNFSNTSLNADTYAWSFGDGVTSTEENPTHTYLETGDFIVELEVTRCGVSNVYSTTVTVDGLSIPEIVLPSLRIHPNPTNNVIIIKGIEVGVIEEFKLYDLLGKSVIAINNPNKLTIDISQIDAGPYFLVITTQDGHSEIRKVIKH